MKIKFHKIPRIKLWYFISFLITIFLVFSWTKIGFVLGTAEENISFYNLKRTVSVVDNIWIDSGLGNASPFYISRTPYYFVMSLFEKIGLSGWTIQAITFIFLLFIPFIYVPKIFEFFSSEKNITRYLAALFYLFNLYTMTQIFNRFIILFIFVWSLLPVFFYYWIKWIKFGRLKYLVLFQLFSLLYSYAFGLPSTLVVVWLPAFLYVVYTTIVSKDTNHLIKAIKGFLLWVILNLWWLYPLLVLRNNTYSQMLNSESSINSLKEVTKYYSNLDIFYLKQKFYTETEGYFKTFLNERKNIIALNVLVYFVLVGVITSLKNKNIRYFLLLLIVSWFLVKGVNPPFGDYFYNLIFAKFPFMQILRNPYEKLGVIFLLPYSIFFAIGVVFTMKKLPKILSMLPFIIGVGSIVLISRPLLSGDVFFDYYYVKVPHYYKEANSIINQNTSGRILHLPFHLFPAIKYQWNYRGEEPSRFLFDYPSISQTTSFKDQDNLFYLIPNYFGNNNFTNILSVLNVGSVVLHNDVVSDKYYVGGVNSSEDNIKMWNNVSFLKSIGELKIYKVNKTSNIIYAADKVEGADNLNETLNLIVKEEFDPTSTVILEKELKNKNKYIDNVQKLNLEYKKIDSRHYIVSIKNATNPYFLVMSNNFNKNWILKYGDAIINTHYTGNGYANTWYIDRMGDYNLDIVFEVWPWD